VKVGSEVYDFFLFIAANSGMEKTGWQLSGVQIFGIVSLRLIFTICIEEFELGDVLECSKKR